MKLNWVRTTIILAALALPTLLPATVITLGTAANYAVFGLAGSETITNSKVTINGNEGISQGGSISQSAVNATVNGNVYEFSSGQLSTSAGVTGSVNVAPATLSQNDTDVANLLTNIAGLTATQTFGNITSATTITGSGNGVLNVIKINGNITLAGSNAVSLTLSGNANDYFVVEVSGGLNLSGGGGVPGAGSQLNVAGGVTATHVLYDFTGTMGTVTTSGCPAGFQICTNKGNTAFGTLLAPNLSYQLDATINGEVISGQNGSLISGGTITQQAFFIPTPEPASLLLLGTGIAGILTKLRKRTNGN